MSEQRPDGFTALEERFKGFNVQDSDGDRVGKVDDLFVNERDEPEYIGVKMGFLGTRSTLIPMDVASVDEQNRVIRVSAQKDQIKDGPSFDDDREITPEYENEVRSYYGLGALEGTTDRGSYGGYPEAGRAANVYTDEEQVGSGREGTAGDVGPGMVEGDTDSGRFEPHGPGQEGVNEPGDDLRDEDELRVQRSEEELHAGTREREAGAVRVRKRVRTERERLNVPTRHEEVSVDRVPVEGGRAPESEIGEGEISVPVTEEEVVVEKRPVVKEEVRLRKDVVQGEEVVEDDVRKEEVEIDDETTTRRRDDDTGRADR